MQYQNQPDPSKREVITIRKRIRLTDLPFKVHRSQTIHPHPKTRFINGPSETQPIEFVSLKCHDGNECVWQPVDGVSLLEQSLFVTIAMNAGYGVPYVVDQLEWEDFIDAILFPVQEIEVGDPTDIGEIRQLLDELDVDENGMPIKRTFEIQKEDEIIEPPRKYETIDFDPAGKWVELVRNAFHRGYDEKGSVLIARASDKYPMFEIDTPIMNIWCNGSFDRNGSKPVLDDVKLNDMRTAIIKVITDWTPRAGTTWYKFTYDVANDLFYVVDMMEAVWHEVDLFKDADDSNVNANANDQITDTINGVEVPRESNANANANATPPGTLRKPNPNLRKKFPKHAPKQPPTGLEHDPNFNPEKMSTPTNENDEPSDTGE